MQWSVCVYKRASKIDRILYILHNLKSKGLSVFVSYSCHNKLPQPWLKATEMYLFIVLEARSLKSRSRQGHTPFRGSWGESAPCIFQFLLALGIPCFAEPPTSVSTVILPPLLYVFSLVGLSNFPLPRSHKTCHWT